jgi:tetratricopeptide (TPR) repeat protein
MKVHVPFRCALLLVPLLTGVGLSQAQSSRPAANPAETMIRQVRTAIGRGLVNDAQTIASGTAGTPASRELGMALVEIYKGNDTSARRRLQQTIADGTVGREAILELGLLEMRHGERGAAKLRLQPLVNQTSLNAPDDYFLLARAARASGEPFLANSAYNKVEGSGRADIYAERGDLFMQFHQYGEAMTEYRKAVEADEKWVAAHVGAARALATDDPEAAAAAFEGAKKLAPESPEVWLLAAERALNADDAKAAKEALDRVATLRPDSVEEAALRAGVAYFERQPAAIDAAVARVKTLNPMSGEAFRAAGQAAARKYRFIDAADFAKKAVALDPDDAAAFAELGLYLLRTGDEADARVALEASWARDKSDVVTKNLLEMLDKLDTFVVVPHNEFLFKFPKAEAEVLKPYAFPLADEAYQTFSTRYGFKPTGPILIEVFDKHDDFAVRTVGLMGMTGALGACFGRVVTMDSPRARPPGDFSWQATLWHELAHVFTLQASQSRVPRWLTEGLSVYEEHRRTSSWGRELTIEFARTLQKGKNFGVKGMPDAFKHPQSLSMAYFEASLVVEHLMDLKGEPALRALLKAYGEGLADAEALQAAYGQSMDQLHTSYTTFVQQRYKTLAEALADPPSQVDPRDVDALKARADAAPGNFYSQWLYGQAAFRAEDFAAARPVLERAAQLAPPASGAASPRMMLAQIAEKQGDEARARKELRDLLAYDHTNIVAARQLAALAAKASATEDQDLALRLVADLDPFDAPIHTQLGKREAAKGRNAAALIEFQAALALNPANLAEAHTDLGETMLKLNRHADARKSALQALQLAPTYSRAQDLLLSASAGR